MVSSRRAGGAVCVVGGALVVALGLMQGRARAQDQGVPPPSVAGLPPERVVVVPVPPAQPAQRPFQMGFEFLRVLDEDGDLAHPGQAASSLGLRFIFSEGRALRQHLALAHHWEQQGNTSRRGFRLDLIGIGFPIPILAGKVQLAVEPILRVLRGQILFVSVDQAPSRSLLRVESGFALAATATYRTWFVVLEPMSIDFRYLQMTREESHSGFSRIWSVAGTIGREF